MKEIIDRVEPVSTINCSDPLDKLSTGENMAALVGLCKEKGIDFEQVFDKACTHTYTDIVGRKDVDGLIQLYKSTLDNTLTEESITHALAALIRISNRLNLHPMVCLYEHCESV